MTKRDSSPKGPAIKRFAMTPLAVGVVAAMNPGSVAQAQDDDNNLGIEEIVVTATKRTMSIQDVPQSITAFSTMEIERRGLLDMADIAGNLPSVSLSTQRAGRNELVYRGISTGGEWRLDSQVAMYLDEMPMTMSTTQLDPRMVDIARVESLPGPQGTLFGSSSQSGTLRVVTNKPQFDGFSGQVVADVRTTSGGEESWDINGHLNIPVSDNLALRLVAYSNKEGGYVDNVYSTAPHSVCASGAECDYEFGNLPSGHLDSATPDNAGLEEDDYNDYTTKGARLSALWNMNDNWSLLTSLMYQESETTGVWFSDTELGDYKVARFSDEWRKDDWSTAMLTLDGDLGFAVLTNSFGYAERQQTYLFDNTHYEASHTREAGGYWSYLCNYYAAYADYYGYAPNDPDYGCSYYFGAYNYYDKYHTGYNGGVYRSLQDATRITNELRLTSSSDSRFQWMVGAFYENNQDGWFDSAEIPNLASTISTAYTEFRSCQLNDDGYAVACPLPPTDNIWYTDNYSREITQIAAFGEVSYDLTEQLTLTTGLRWFEYDRLTINDQQWPPGLPVEGILLDGESAFIEEGKESDTAMKLGLSYTLDDDKMLYALYNEGFRLGGSNNPKAVRINFVPKTYDPDKLKNYETGIKSEWLDNSLQLNATVFYMEWEDIQLNIDSDQVWWLTGQVNGGGGQNLGFEVDFDWRITRDLRLSGSAYVGDAHYTDDYITPEGIVEMSAGTRMPGAPNNKYNLAIDYTFQDVWGGDMFARLDGYYVGSMFSDLDEANAANPLAPPDADGDPVYVPGSSEDVDSFSKYNFQVGYTSGEGDWSAIIMVRNLTDARANSFTGHGTEEYAEYWGHTGFGATNTLARPRSISLKLTKNF
jgi:iron complex outermembrane receptor protein